MIVLIKEYATYKIIYGLQRMFVTCMYGCGIGHFACLFVCVFWLFKLGSAYLN